MCNVEIVENIKIAEIYAVENAPYCKLNYNMTRFLFYLLSFLYYLFCLAVGIFPVFCSHIPTAVYFFAFLLGCGYFSCLLFSHTHSSLFFFSFLLGCGYFSCLMLSIPTAVYFLLHFCLAVGIFPFLCSPYP